MKIYKNSLGVILILVGIITIFSAAVPFKKLPPKYKKLKILPKNISEAALNKIMEDYNLALGVNCNYCHANSTNLNELNFASDTKPEKNAARRMMLMTYDINIKYFGGTKNRLETQAIECITCHRQYPYPTIDTIKNKKAITF